MQSKEQKREEALKDLAAIRNYVIDVLATAVLKADGRTTQVEAMTEKLAAQESAMYDIIEKR